MKKLGLTSIEGYITEDFGADEAPEMMEFKAGLDTIILGEKLKEEVRNMDCRRNYRHYILDNCIIQYHISTLMNEKLSEIELAMASNSSFLESS